MSPADPEPPTGTQVLARTIDDARQLNADIVQSLTVLQHRLYDLQGPPKAGSVYLRLRDCNKHCAGCPHAQLRLHVLRTHRQTGAHFLASVALQRPLRTRAARDPEVRPYLEAAIELMRTRARFTRQVQSLRTSITRTRRVLDLYR